MNYKISPSKIQGNIVLPPSETQSMYALALAVLVESSCRISNILLSQSILDYISHLQALGARIERKHDEIIVYNTVSFQNHAILEVQGNDIFLPSLLTIAGLIDAPIHIKGNISLSKLGPLLKALTELGAIISDVKENTTLTIRGPLKGGECTIDSINSRALAALLTVLPLAPYPSEISISHLKEHLYMGITLNWLNCLGIEYNQKNNLLHFHIPGTQNYIPFDYFVGGDSTVASFLFCAAAITGSTIVCDNIKAYGNKKSLGVIPVLEKMGCEIHIQFDTLFPQKIRIKSPKELQGGTFSVAHMTEICIASLVAVACYTKSKTTFKGFVRMQGTGIIDILQRELKKIGVNIEISEDSITVISNHPLSGTDFDSHRSRGAAMALSIIALGTNSESTIHGMRTNDTTLTLFFHMLKQLQA